MSVEGWIAVAALGLAAMAVAVGSRVYRSVRERGLDRWAPVAVFGRRKLPLANVETDELTVLIAVCDHYEPQWGKPSVDAALERVRDWTNAYPALFSQFRDSDGRPPQHTFFFPQDEYRPEYLDELATLCRAGFGDVDIHLHHHDDTPDGLREKLASFRDDLVNRHGLLRIDSHTGKLAYGFIHGNWALCNSRRDGQWCGVDHELPILLETGCYADFTFPSAPSDTQPPTINSIYYASDSPQGRRAHEHGLPAGAGVEQPANSLLMIQGPLLFDGRRKKFGVLPRVENGDLLGNHPPSIERLPLWVNAGVTVAGHPQVRFVKLHTHGCKPSNQRMWLSETTQRFHADLAALSRRNPRFKYRYVTAWEMANAVRELKSTPPRS